MAKKTVIKKFKLFLYSLLKGRKTNWKRVNEKMWKSLRNFG